MTTAVRRAPMFAALFLASRMRALQLDPPYGMPPVWMQQCFLGVTALVYVEVLLSFLIGTLGTLRCGEFGVYLFRCEWRALHFIQHLSTMVSSAAVGPIIYGVLMMEDKTLGTAADLSTTVRMTLILSAIFFGIMFGQSFTFFVEDMTKLEYPTWQQTFVRAGVSIGFAPLLSVLFIACRMRALQITQGEGAPQGWAQDCMIMAVFATCVQASCCILMPLFIGAACKVDEDGNPDYDLKPMVGAYTVQVVKYISLIVLHGSVIAICCAVFMMTPETAHGKPLRRIQGAKALLEMLALTLVIVLIALLLSSAKVIGMAVKMAIESVDRPLLGTDIEIKSAALNLCKGYINIRDVVVKQPEEDIHYETDEWGTTTATPTGNALTWQSEYLMKINLVLVKINLWRLITSGGREFEITNLSLTGIHANIEKPTADMHVHDSNLDHIIKHIDHLGLPKLDVPDLKIGVPRAVLHKIALGDIGCCVTVDKVPVLGKIRFSPNIGVLKFDDVQEQVFQGKEDLTGGQAVAMVVKALTKGIIHAVKDNIPHYIAKMTKKAAGAMVHKSANTMRSFGNALRSRACPSRSQAAP